MQDCGPRHTYVCIYAQLRTLLAYSIRAVPFQCRRASKSSNINITSTQSTQQTGSFSQPWRLSQLPESSAGQSAVDHLYEGPGHLSLQAAAAGLEWKPGPEALLLVCPAMHLNHELRHHLAVLCNQTLNTPLGMLSAVVTSFTAIQALLGSGTFKVSRQDASCLRLIGLQLNIEHNRIIRSTEQILRYKD